MPWHYRDIQTFSARFQTSMSEAVASLGEPILFNHYGSLAAAETVAETFRYFRWCIRTKPGINRTLDQFEALYQFRLSSETNAGRTFLFVTAKPTKLSELHSLNPHLADLISAECQQ